MIYLGHFSCRSEKFAPQAASWHGYFTYVAEAESVENALRKFQAQLRRLARTTSLFSDVDEVYLGSCIEIKSIRKAGFLAYYKETRGECNEAISTSLLGVGPNDRDVTAYQFTGKRFADDVAGPATQPFVVFEH
jgi:hypothetical protein